MVAIVSDMVADTVADKMADMVSDMMADMVAANNKTSQELRMLSSVTINCQITKIVMNSGSQLSVL